MEHVSYKQTKSVVMNSGNAETNCAFQNFGNVMETMIAEISAMKDHAEMTSVGGNSFSVIIRSAFLNTGDAITTMIVEMEVMRRIVQTQHARIVSLDALMVSASTINGDEMSESFQDSMNDMPNISETKFFVT